jgi:hypothetical protein
MSLRGRIALLGVCTPTPALAAADVRPPLQAVGARMKKAVSDGVDASASVTSGEPKPIAQRLGAAARTPGNGSRNHLERQRE